MDNIADQLFQLAIRLGCCLKSRQLLIAIAESCTGGLVSEIITSIPQSSVYFERGFVTYSNIAKIELLGVNASTIEQYGAVSEQTACEMALGALKHSHASVSISITGIAGPNGATPGKPVGTVFIGFAGSSFNTQIKRCHFKGDRNEVRMQAAKFALAELLRILES